MSHKERGSALLIVFLFAAVVAIMLYKEMPVAAFEAQRQKEQLLIDRGNEYAHAVKLFVRKMGTYPTSIDQLQNTNNMRFLRHRFKDPFTGKDDWRLLHAGPGGMLTDSKVKPLNANNQNGSGTAGSSNSTFGSSTNSFASSSFSNSSSTFGSSSTSSNAGNSSGDQVQVAQVPQRRPELAASSAVPAGEASSAPGADPTSISPVLAPGQATQFPAAYNSPVAPTSQTAVQPPFPGQPGGQNNSGAIPVTDPANTTPMLRNLLTNPNTPLPQTPTTGPTNSPNSSNSPGSPQMGVIAAGSIAGVASIAKGHSIKTVKDQTDYSLWEFYYDPTQNGLPGVPGNTPAGAAPAANPSANTSPFGTNAFTLNSPGLSSAPGNTFGQPPPSSSGIPPPNPPPNPPPVPQPNPPPE